MSSGEVTKTQRQCRSRGETTMSQFEVRARLKVRDGKLEGSSDKRLR
jgi:hypothetical protein